MAARQNTPQIKNARQRAPIIASRLADAYPDAKCALRFRNPLELSIATILSAPCTDAKVNQVTKGLFGTCETAADYAQAELPQLEDVIRPTGFFRNKAKSIRNCCRLLVERHGGQVPDSMDALVKLPGIGRKTANVILGTAMGIPSGVVVDTHVSRLSKRMGLTRHESPEKIERVLMDLLPVKEWINFSHRMIHHGRRVCSARKPACEKCCLKDLCPKIGVRPK